jgi:hypothetical protein
VQTDFRIPDVRAVRRYCDVVAFIEDGVETDRRDHELHMGRNVLWKMIGVPNLRRQDALDLRLNFCDQEGSLPTCVRANRCCTGSAEDVLPPPTSHMQSAHLLTHSLSSRRIILHFLANHRSSRTASVNKSKYADEANLLCEWCNLVICRQCGRSSAGRPTRHLHHQALHGLRPNRGDDEQVQESSVT